MKYRVYICTLNWGIPLKSKLNIVGFLLSCYCIAVIIISSFSNPEKQLNLSRGPVPHFIEYSLMGILVLLFFRTVEIKKNRAVLVALIFCWGFALSDELHQFFVPGREMSLEDVRIDCIASSIGIIAAEFGRRYLFPCYDGSS